MADRVSIDDLLFAEDWLANGYEGDPDEDSNVNAGKRVAAWIRAEIERREQEAADRAAITEVMQKTGCTRAAAKRALVKIKARDAARKEG